MLLDQFNSGRIPSVRILEHNKCECSAIIHFGLNSYTDQEWGFGNADPALFNPAEFDAEELVRNCLEGGLTALTLVCKHHDGFCLWPTETTDYNISRSPFRNGKGDLVKEVSGACCKYGMKMGFYCSPWDRHDPDYGTEAYVEKYQQQLRELCSNYGPAYEFWFDGANGGDGWYGGANEKRSIDQITYYRWPETWQIIRNLQPQAAIFSDVGPDIRWVGNEKGLADEECFGSYTPHSRLAGVEPSAGNTCYLEGTAGHADGCYYIPAECDVPLRPGWFYHPSEDDSVKTLYTMIDIYMHSVGCASFLNIGLAPAPNGKLHPNDVRRLREFKLTRDKLFEKCVFSGVQRPAGKHKICFDLDETRNFNLLEMAEPAEDAEAVDGYRITLQTADGSSQLLLEGRAIGRKRLKKLSEAVSGRQLIIEFDPESELPETLTLKLYEADFPEPAADGSDVFINKLSLPIPENGPWVFRLNAPTVICGFIFTPDPALPPGTPTHYRFSISGDGEEWNVIEEGEFSNIQNNPIAQRITFKKQHIIYYCRLEAAAMLQDAPEIKGLGLDLLRI